MPEASDPPQDNFELQASTENMGKPNPRQMGLETSPAANPNQILLTKFETAIREPLDPNTPQEVVDAVIGLSTSPNLNYSEALTIKRNLESFTAVTSLGSALRNDQLRAAFIEARKQIWRIAQVAETLEEFHRLAQTTPDFFDLDKRKIYAFVNGSIPETYPPDDPETVRILEQYNDESRAEYLYEVLDKLPNIDSRGGAGIWREISAKGQKLNWRENKWPKGTQSLPDGGRIYLNAKPLVTDRVFYELARLMDEQKTISFSAKMIAHGSMDPEDLNRADRIVLWFEAKDQAVILKVVQELYQKVGSKAFDKNTPQFAAKLTDSSGAVMAGIAFGQEPSADILKENGFTFNNLREEVLLRLEGALNPSDLENKFREQLREYRIDASWPAFNVPPEKGKLLYPFIVANSR